MGSPQLKPDNAAGVEHGALKLHRSITWSHEYGAAQSGIRYPVVVRFPTVNYAGVSTNNYSLDEVKEV